MRTQMPVPACGDSDSVSLEGPGDLNFNPLPCEAAVAGPGTTPLRVKSEAIYFSSLAAERRFLIRTDVSAPTETS